eukprot:1193061-Amorphochlora_amoeboformis.AAC.1
MPQTIANDNTLISSRPIHRSNPQPNRSNQSPMLVHLFHVVESGVQMGSVRQSLNFIQIGFSWPESLDRVDGGYYEPA